MKENGFFFSISDYDNSRTPKKMRYYFLLLLKCDTKCDTTTYCFTVDISFFRISFSMSKIKRN